MQRNFSYEPGSSVAEKPAFTLGSLPSVVIREEGGREATEFLSDLGIVTSPHGTWSKTFALHHVPSLQDLLAGAELSPHADVTDEHFPTAVLRPELFAHGYKIGGAFEPRGVVHLLETDGLQPGAMRELAFYANHGWDGHRPVAALADPWDDQLGRPKVGWLHSIDGRRTLSLKRFDLSWTGDWFFLAVPPRI